MPGLEAPSVHRRVHISWEGGPRQPVQRPHVVLRGTWCVLCTRGQQAWAGSQGVCTKQAEVAWQGVHTLP